MGSGKLLLASYGAAGVVGLIVAEAGAGPLAGLMVAWLGGAAAALLSLAAAYSGRESVATSGRGRREHG